MKKKSITPYLLIIFTFLLCVFFAFATPTFMKLDNIMNLLQTTVVYSLCSIGLALVLITGEVDFSVASVLTLAGCCMTVFSKNIPYAVAFLATLVICAVFGLINGALHTRLGIPAFISTMGVSFIASGLSKLVTDNGTVFCRTTTFRMLGQGRIWRIPISIIVFAVIAVLALLYTEWLTNGRKLYCVGANSTTCKYVGIDPKKEKMKSFMLCSLLCGVAGIISASQAASASPSMGDGAMNTVLTILMLGATCYKIGVFNVPGTIVGSILLNVITNGLVLLSAPTWTQYLVKGLVMICGVTYITLRRQGKTFIKKKKTALT